MFWPKRLSGILFFAVLWMITNGCASGYVSKESIGTIRSIEIDPNIAIPYAPGVHGAVNVANNLFLGLMTGSSPMPGNVGASFGAYMDRNGIRMDEIVLSTFRRNLAAHGYVEVREDADATLELAVLRYGFRMPAFDITKNQRNPDLLVQATLRSKDETVLWTAHKDTILWSELTHTNSIQTLLGNPRVVERSLEEASCVIAYLLLSDLYAAGLSSGRSPSQTQVGPVCTPVVHRESRIECQPDVGCTQVTTESWEFAPSRDPGELRKMCTRDVGCVYE